MSARSVFAGLAFVLIIVFVGVLPVVIDLQRMPTGRKAAPPRTPVVASWPAWPDRAPANLSPTGQQTFRQISGFANRSLYPMSMLERTIRDYNNGRATSNDVYEAERAAAASVEDERDALMGLILSPGVRENDKWQAAWHHAQFAALAKLEAIQFLEDNPDQHAPWTRPAYQHAVDEARSETNAALAAASRAGTSLTGRSSGNS